MGAGVKSNVILKVDFPDASVFETLPWLIVHKVG